METYGVLSSYPFCLGEDVDAGLQFHWRGLLNDVCGGFKFIKRFRANGRISGVELVGEDTEGDCRGGTALLQAQLPVSAGGDTVGLFTSTESSRTF